MPRLFDSAAGRRMADVRALGSVLLDQVGRRAIAADQVGEVEIAVKSCSSANLHDANRSLVKAEGPGASRTLNRCLFSKVPGAQEGELGNGLATVSIGAARPRLAGVADH